MLGMKIKLILNNIICSISIFNFKTLWSLWEKGWKEKEWKEYSPNKRFALNIAVAKKICC